MPRLHSKNSSAKSNILKSNRKITKRDMKRTIMAMALCLALTATGCKPKTAEQHTETVRVEQVETTILKPVEVMRTLDFSTTLEGYQPMSVDPGVTGRIDHIFVEVGTRV